MKGKVTLGVVVSNLETRGQPKLSGILRYVERSFNDDSKEEREDFDAEVKSRLRDALRRKHPIKRRKIWKGLQKGNRGATC